MNQVEEEECLYRALEEEAIDVDSLLVEPRSDQVSVSDVWCFEEDNLAKCMKIDDIPGNFGVTDSNINIESVDTTKLNVLDVMPHEVEVENLLTTNGVSACDDYLLDIGFVEHVTSIDYGSNEGLHMGSSSSESQVPGFNESDKGIFRISPLLSGCQNDFLGKTTCDLQGSFSCNYVFGTPIAEDKSSKFTTSFESKSLDVFEDVSNSLICIENNKDNPTPHFARDDSVGATTQKRMRKPTKRYIDESSILDIIKCKKKKEISPVSKVKILGVRRSKLTSHQMKPKAKMASSEISFDKAIQVPFVSQGPTEYQENHTSTVVEKCVESYSNGSEDESGTTMRSMVGGNQRKLHRLWTVSEVKKLIDGVAHFGVGKWTHIKKLLFSSSVHRTPVDLKDKWRNLLKASCALQGSKIEEEQKRSQPWRPLPKSILCRVRELATVYPYPREVNSKSKLALVPHVSSPARIKGNRVTFL